MNSTPDPTRNALYSAILAHPDEDTPRLAYADHIEEMDDSARAEFIRLQCRLAPMNEWDDGHTAAEVRCRRLLAEHSEWLDAVPQFTRGARAESAFARGFPEHAELSGFQFLDRHPELFAAIPLRSVKIVRDRIDGVPFQRLARCAALGRLRRLMLPLENDTLGALADVPHLAGLEQLHVWVASVDIDLLRELVESPHLRNLRSFTFRAYGHHGHEPNANWQ
jgi:uncharacterized protein (TIGR02996 family)